MFHGRKRPPEDSFYVRKSLLRPALMSQEASGGVVLRSQEALTQLYCIRASCDRETTPPEASCDISAGRKSLLRPSNYSSGGLLRPSNDSAGEAFPDCIYRIGPQVYTTLKKCKICYLEFCSHHGSLGRSWPWSFTSPGPTF